MLLDNALIGDVLISYGDGESNWFMRRLFSVIRSAQKSVGYKAYESVHVQVKAFDSNMWASTEEHGVIIHQPVIREGLRYKLVRPVSPITSEGVHALQSYVTKMEGRKYDKLQLVGIGIFSIRIIPLFLRRSLAKRVDGGGAYTVCSGLVYDALKAAGVNLPLPRSDPNWRNPGERSMPALFDPINSPEFDLVAEQ